MGDEDCREDLSELCVSFEKKANNSLGRQPNPPPATHYPVNSLCRPLQTPFFFNVITGDEGCGEVSSELCV